VGFSIPEIDLATRTALQSEQAAQQGWTSIGRAYGPRAAARQWGARCTDVGAMRLAEMDDNGIDMAVLGLSSVGLSLLPVQQSVELIALANDRMAEAIRQHPTRFAGLLCVDPCDPVAASDEIERGIKSLGLKGVLINSSSRGVYLDDPLCTPILETLDLYRVPLYLHPTLPSSSMIHPYLNYGLAGAMWGFAAEAGLHALRMILCGAFDRFPNLRVVLGHLGEGLPYFLQRIDEHQQATRGATPHLKRLPSEVFLEHFWVTTSGMNDPLSVRLCLDRLGQERVMFAVDYPYEETAKEVKRFAAIPLNSSERELVSNGNAKAVFGLV
jgi:2,3-dihydroxybenzoate decarboxylase